MRFFKTWKGVLRIYPEFWILFFYLRGKKILRVRNNNSAELQNQRTYEAYKQFHFCEGTSNRRIGSLL